MSIRLNLGTGPDRLDGYISLDRCRAFKPEILCDLERGLPIRDGSVDEIFASHTLEHITNLIPLMNDCWRVLKPYGAMKIIVPHYRSIGAYQDPTHVRFFTEKTFDYFLKDSPYAHMQISAEIQCRFTLLYLRTTKDEIFAILLKPPSSPSSPSHALSIGVDLAFPNRPSIPLHVRLRRRLIPLLVRKAILRFMHELTSAKAQRC